MGQPRQPGGTPAGGQFAPGQQQRAALSLPTDPQTEVVKAVAARTGWAQETHAGAIFRRRAGRIEIVVDPDARIVSVYDRGETASVGDLPIVMAGYEPDEDGGLEKGLAQALGVLGPEPPTLNDAEREELFRLERQFAEAGGRGVDLAERLDVLRARADPFQRHLAAEGARLDPEAGLGWNWTSLAAVVGYPEAERLYLEHDGSLEQAAPPLAGGHSPGGRLLAARLKYHPEPPTPHPTT